MYVYQVTAWDAFMISIFVALCYPMWLHILRNANWDVFGDRDPNNLTITGATVFQFVTSFSIGLMSATYFSITQSIAPEESLQFLVHLTIGDTLGAGVVVYLFYLYMKFATKKIAVQINRTSRRIFQRNWTYCHTPIVSKVI